MLLLASFWTQIIKYTLEYIKLSVPKTLSIILFINLSGPCYEKIKNWDFVLEVHSFMYSKVYHTIYGESLSLIRMRILLIIVWWPKFLIWVSYKCMVRIFLRACFSCTDSSLVAIRCLLASQSRRKASQGIRLLGLAKLSVLRKLTKYGKDG